DIFTRAYAWVQEKPLRIFGYGSFVPDFFLGLEAIKGYKKAKAANFAGTSKTGIALDFTYTGAYLISDILVSLAKKDGSGGMEVMNADEQRIIEASAAEALIGQTPDRQEAIAQELGGYLTTRYM